MLSNWHLRKDLNFESLISKIFHPGIISPTIFLILTKENTSLLRLILLVLTIIVALVGLKIESYKQTHDNYKFNLKILRIKRYGLLIVGIIYFFIISFTNLNFEVIFWSKLGLIFMIVFLFLTYLTKVKYSAHLFFFIFNFWSIKYFFVSDVFFIISTLIMIILLSFSRLKLIKHNLNQILITVLISYLIIFIYEKF